MQEVNNRKTSRTRAGSVEVYSHFHTTVSFKLETSKLFSADLKEPQGLRSKESGQLETGSSKAAEVL